MYALWIENTSESDPCNRWKIVTVSHLVLRYFLTAVGNVPANVKETYLKHLKFFDTSRNHYRQEQAENLENATMYVKSLFKAAGLDTYLQSFTTGFEKNGKVGAEHKLVNC